MTKLTGLLNCHSRGLHSIVLKVYPNGRPRVRMFIATSHHTLWKNNPVDDLSIAIHPHRCYLTIHHLSGPLANINFEITDSLIDPYQIFNKYKYHSAILNGNMEFENIGYQSLIWSKPHFLKESERLFLSASQLHTVNVAKGFEAAWIIEEGDLDPNYDAIVYSQKKPEVDIKLYQPMSEELIEYFLKKYSRELVGYFFRE